MRNDWRRYLDEDCEDEIIKVEKIPHKPNKYQENKPERRIEKPQKKSK